MSVSKWRYTEECNGRPCPGDCDHCSFEPEDLISRADAMGAVCKWCEHPYCKSKEECGQWIAMTILPSAENPKADKRKIQSGDLISRQVLMDRLESFCKWCKDGRLQGAEFVWDCIVPNVPSAEAYFTDGNKIAEWIPCSKKMPKELERVNITWLNHNPPFYYQHIKDIPQTDTAVYYRGKWYWWDVTVIDILAEYGEDCNAEQIDKDIEVVAWIPLPMPYREDGEV